MSLLRRWFGHPEDETQRMVAELDAEDVRARVADQLIDLRETLQAIREREDQIHGGRRSAPG